MHSRTRESYKFEKSLGLKLHNVTICKDQRALQSIKDAFGRKNMKGQYSALDYEIDC